MAKAAPDLLPSTLAAAASKRNRPASISIMFLALLFLFVIIGLNLINPVETQAHPEYGFTPQPPPPPATPTGNDSDQEGDDDEDDSDQPPPHEVTVQIETCNLSCSTGMAPEDKGGGDLLAFASTNNPLNQTAGPIGYDPVSPEMLLHVRLIHLGSGFITEGTISDAKPVSFPVPYPDNWQVFLLDPPEFVTADTVDLAGTNLETLQTNLSKGPLYLGTVQADTDEPQRLPCPLNCPTAAADFKPGPVALPESGADTPSMPVLPFISSGILLFLAFFAYQRYRTLRPVYLPWTTLGKTPARLHADHRVGFDRMAGYLHADRRVDEQEDIISKSWDA
jgi:hypothetical protein